MMLDARSAAAGGNEAPAAHEAGFVTLGRRRICRLGLGTMRLTGPQFLGPPSDVEAALRVLRTAVELGVQFVDTADSYGPDIVEDLIARALSPYRDDLVVATKGGYLRGDGASWKPDCRPERLRAACEASLRRLKLDRHPLYQLHCIDPDVPLRDSMRALVDLQAEGKIEMIGLSNVTVAQLREAAAIAPVVSVQNRYNLTDRGSDAVLAECEASGIAFIPYSPLGEGTLSATDLPAFADDDGRPATPSQAAIAWLLALGPNVLPIPGTSSEPHLRENVAAAGFRSPAASARPIEGS